MNPDPQGKLFDFLRFASVSAQPAHAPDTRACAEWLVATLLEIGLQADLHETPGYPIVLAKSQHDPNKRTVLIYGHYDVQPAEPFHLWTTPPFEPALREGRVYARGATDNKGQILAHILGIAASLSEGDLPVNIIFLIEGEEEVGSGNLAAFLESHRDALACDAIAISDTGMAADGFPTLSYSLRGIAAMEVRVLGPSHDLHSGIFGGAIANPATAAARLIASLHDGEGRVAIPGFYDSVQPMASWERLAAAESPLRDEHIAAEAGVTELFGEPGFSAVERIGARPTAEVNGLGGGYQGEGSKTVLPAEAFFKLTFRLVANQNPTTILDLATAHLQAHCPRGIRIEITRGHGGEPFFSDPQTPDGLAAQRALLEVFGRSPALLREGGSIPILKSFETILGRAPILLGLASPDCCIHAPDENFPLANFYAGIALNQALMRELAQ